MIFIAATLGLIGAFRRPLTTGIVIGFIGTLAVLT
jgi:hypothetical protein